MPGENTTQSNVPPVNADSEPATNQDTSEQPGSEPGKEDQEPAQQQDPQNTGEGSGSEPGGDDDVQNYDQPKAIKELIANRKAKQEAQRKVAELQAQIDFYNQSRQSASNQPVQHLGDDGQDQAPKIENYEDYDKYEQERIRYEARKIVKEEWKQQQEEAKKTNDAKTYQQRMHEATLKSPELKEKLEKARSQWTPDLMQAINKNGAAYEIMVSEKAPEIEGYFADNPGEAFKLAQMDQRQAIKEIARIEARFDNKPASTKQTQKTSQAPPPIKSASGNASSVNKDISKMSMEEYAAYRDRQRFGK